MNNSYGLDADYFKLKFNRISRDVYSYTQSEMARELLRMVKILDNEVLEKVINESEFMNFPYDDHNWLTLGKSNICNKCGMEFVGNFEGNSEYIHDIKTSPCLGRKKATKT